MGRIVGIDLGTTYSLVAFMDAPSGTGKPQCIVGPYGSALCPSIVSVDADGNIVAGEAARRRLLTQAERTIYSVKRLMGRARRCEGRAEDFSLPHRAIEHERDPRAPRR